jgi:hypothetical protein
MGIVDRLRNLTGKAEDTAVEHKDQIRQAVQKAEATADQRTVRPPLSALQCESEVHGRRDRESEAEEASEPIDPLGQLQICKDRERQVGQR